MQNMIDQIAQVWGVEPIVPIELVILDEAYNYRNLLPYLNEERRRAIIFFPGGPTRSFDDILYWNHLPDLTQLLEFLQRDAVVSGEQLMLALYSLLGERPIVVMRRLAEHTAKHDPDFQLAEEALADIAWSHEQIFSAIDKELVHLTAFYLSQGEQEIAREVLALGQENNETQRERLRELYYQTIGRRKIHKIVCVVDDMFNNEREVYREQQAMIARMFPDYRLCCLKDGVEALEFYRDNGDNIELFLLDVNFYQAHRFVDAQGREINAASPEFQRSQGLHLERALRYEKYDKGIIVFTAETIEEKIAHLTQKPLTRYWSKANFFGRPDRLQTTLRELGIEISREDRLQKIALKRYGCSLAPAVVHAIFERMRPYKTGRRTWEICEKFFDLFPQEPPILEEIDSAFDQAYIESFAEDHNWRLWIELPLSKLKLEVCPLDHETPLLLLRSLEPEAKYFLGAISDKGIEGLDCRQIELGDNDSPFCLHRYYLCRREIEQNWFDYNKQNDNYTLRDMFTVFKPQFIDNPSETWEHLQKIKLKGKWNPWSSFYGKDDKVLPIPELASFFYRQNALLSLDSRNLFPALFYSLDNPEAFYDNLRRTDLPTPALSRHFSLVQCERFMNEYERVCFFMIANNIDKAIGEHSQLKLQNNKQAIDPQKYIIFSNPLIKGREVDMLIATPSCYFFIEVKSYNRVEVENLQNWGDTLQKIINEKFQRHYKDYNSKFCTYKIIISKDTNNANNQTEMAVNTTLHVTNNKAWLKLICQKIYECNFSSRMIRYRNKIKVRHQELFDDLRNSRQYRKNVQNCISIDSFYISTDCKYRSARELIDDQLHIMYWNNQFPLLIPYQLRLLNAEKQEVISSDNHEVAFFEYRYLLPVSRYKAKNFQEMQRLRLAKTFFDSLRAASSKTMDMLRVNSLSARQLWVSSTGTRRLYLKLDHKMLCYQQKTVAPGQHIGTYFPQILKLLDITPESFYYFYTKGLR